MAARMASASEAFALAGWTVRHFDRKTQTLEDQAAGVDVIVNGWNPPYPDWATQVPALHRAVQQVALVQGATIIVPGNVYVFGADSPTPWAETSAHLASNPLGRIRQQMEASYRDCGARTIILRAGDFIDTHPSGNWFDQVIVKSLDRGQVVWPGDMHVRHAWAYLPDMARAAVLLADKRADLPRFLDLNFPGYTMTGTEMADLLGQVIGRSVRLSGMSWWPIRMLSLVSPMMRCLIEMSYLWSLDHALDRVRFQQTLPGFHPTPPREALAHAVAHIGSLDLKINPDQTVAAGR